jgi:hypothetical protein
MVDVKCRSSFAGKIVEPMLDLLVGEGGFVRYRTLKSMLASIVLSR